MSDRQAGPPDRRALEMDLGGAAFELGERDKRWRLAAPLEWPYAYIAVSAVERPKAPKEFSLRFNCVGYPKGITASL